MIGTAVNNCADYSKTELDVSTNFNGFEFYRTAAINSKKTRKMFRISQIG